MLENSRYSVNAGAAFATHDQDISTVQHQCQRGSLPAGRYYTDQLSQQQIATKQKARSAVQNDLEGVIRNRALSPRLMETRGQSIAWKEEEGI